MKKITIIIASIIFSACYTTLTAQANKGKFMLGELLYIEFAGNGVLGSTNLGVEFLNHIDVGEFLVG